MVLIVEDGSNVTDANTYVGVSDTRIYSSISGVELPEEDSEVEKLLLQAMRWLEVKEWRGRKTYETQQLSWPRTIDGRDVKVDPKIVEAQNYLVTQLAQGISLFPPVTENAIFSQRVDVISITYANHDRVRSGPAFPYLEELLRNILAIQSFSTHRA